MFSHFMARNLQLPLDAPLDNVFASLFLYEHGAPQEFTIDVGLYPDFELDAQNGIISHANVSTAPFSYTCSKRTQTLNVFLRAQLEASNVENHVLAVRVNDADVLHQYLGIGNEIRLNGTVWLLQGDTMKIELRAENRTLATETLTVKEFAIGAAEIVYFPPKKIEEVSD